MHFKIFGPLYFVLVFVTYGVSSASYVPLEGSEAVGDGNPFVEYLLQKFVVPRLEASLNTVQNDSTKLISDVNTLLGSNILNTNGSYIQIDYNNLLNLIKLQGRNNLAKIIGTNDILLTLLAQHRLSTSLDLYLSPFQGPIKRASFPLNIQARQLRAVTPNPLETVLVRSVFSNLIGQLLTPLQGIVNQTLLSISINLGNLRQQPATATDFFTSIRVSLINEAITQVVNFIELIRNQINAILAPDVPVTPAARALYKRATSTELGTKTTRSVLDVILSPLRFIAGIILSPLHNILISSITNIFVTLRPLVGGLILGPLESLLTAIVNLIPCTNC